MQIQQNEAGRSTPIGTFAIVAPAIAREGITKHIANQIKALQDKNIKVCLIVLAKSDVRTLKEYDLDVEDLPILQLNQTYSYLSPSAFFNVLRLIKSIHKFLESQAVRHAIVHGPYAHFVMRLVKMTTTGGNYKFNLLQYFHGLQYSEYPINSLRRYLVNSLNKLLAKQYDDAHISVAKVVRQEVNNHFIKHPRHEVIYNSISIIETRKHEDDQRWQEIEKMLLNLTQKYIILLPGRIDKNKGQHFFLEVIADFVKAGVADPSDLAVILAGDGPDRVLVEKQIEEQTLLNNIILLGDLPHPVLQKLMHQVNLVVVPSYSEGLPFVVLEALHANKILLASRIGGIPEIIDEGINGYLFEVGNKVDCLQKLIFIYNNRNENLIDLPKHNAERNQKFSAEAQIEKLLKLVRTL